MGVLAFDAGQVRSLSRPPAREADGYFRQVRRFDELTALVEREWQNLPGEVREAAIDLAYSMTGGPTRPLGLLERVVGFVLWLPVQIELAFLPRRNEGFTAWSAAAHRFANAVLSAVERESEAYQRDLVAALQETASEAVSSDERFVEDPREWIKQISDRAVR